MCLCVCLWACTIRCSHLRESLLNSSSISSSKLSSGLSSSCNEITWHHMRSHDITWHTKEHSIWQNHYETHTIELTKLTNIQTHTCSLVPRLSLLPCAFERVKGHTWNYCAEGGRAWERGYTYTHTQQHWTGPTSTYTLPCQSRVWFSHASPFLLVAQQVRFLVRRDRLPSFDCGFPVLTSCETQRADGRASCRRLHDVGRWSWVAGRLWEEAEVVRQSLVQFIIVRELCVYVFNERWDKEGRKKQGHTCTREQGKATQHTQDVTFPNKNELHVHVRVQWVGFNPMTLQSVLPTGWAQILHLIVYTWFMSIYMSTYINERWKKEASKVKTCTCTEPLLKLV